MKNTMKTYLVGGAVRDLILGLESNDKDFVVVGQTPQGMLDLGFSQVGAAFPVFLHPETNDEYALARTERKVGNGYHGFEVDSNPDVTIEDDLSRRDLTINAIAYDADTGDYVDPFNGVSDIQNKILRHVSPAFADDPLRVIRLARFAARFSNFTIDRATHKLACDLVKSGELDHLSSERFWAEMQKVFESNGDVFVFFRTLFEFGVFKHVTFFNSIWDSIDNFTLTSKFRRVLDNTKHLSAEDRMRQFVVITAKKYHAQFDKADVQTTNMYSYVVQYVVTDKRDAHQIFMLLNRIGAYSNTTKVFESFIDTVQTLTASGQMATVPVKVLKQVLHAPRVSASDFPDTVPGPDLGLKIKVARINQLQFFLEQYFSDN